MTSADVQANVAERLPTLFRLSDESESILILLDNAETPEEIEELERTLVENEGRLLAKTEGYVAVIRTLESLADSRKAEADRMALRAKSARERATWLRGRLLAYMKATHQERIDTSKFTVSVKLNPPHVEVLDAAAVPSEYQRTKVTVDVDKRAILDTYKVDGVVPPGVAIERSEGLSLR